MILKILLPLCGIVLGFAIIVFLAYNVKRRNQIPTDQEVNERINRQNQMALERNNPNEK